VGSPSSSPTPCPSPGECKPPQEGGKPGEGRGLQGGGGPSAPRLLEILHPLRGAPRRGSATPGCVDGTFAAERPTGLLPEGQGAVSPPSVCAGANGVRPNASQRVKGFFIELTERGTSPLRSFGTSPVAPSGETALREAFRFPSWSCRNTRGDTPCVAPCLGLSDAGPRDWWSVSESEAEAGRDCR
jgi:hypothetical protein